MSDTNRVQIGIVEEATIGTTPANPNFEIQRITGAPDLAYTPNVVTSDEIRSDRNVADTILVGAQAGGSINFELSYGSFDTLIQAAMFSTWVNTAQRTKTAAGSEIGAVAIDSYAVESVSGNSFVEGHLVRASGFGETANNKLFRAAAGTTATSIATTGNTVEAAPPTGASLKAVGIQGATGDIETTVTGGNALISTVLDFTNFNIVVGQWLKIGSSLTDSSFATAVLNDYVRVSSVSANRLDLDVVPVGWVADDGATKDIVLYLPDYIRNGVLRRSFTIERRYLDQVPITNEYFFGMVLDGFSLTASSQSIVTGDASFSGLSVDFPENRVTGATETAQSISSVYNSSSNVGRIAENGVQIAGQNFVTEFTMTFANNLRQKPAVGYIGAIDIGAGEFGVTGTINTYFDNSTLVQKILGNQETSLDIRFANNAGQVLVIDMPRAKYTAGSPSVPGKNDDVVANLEYQALVSTSIGATLQLLRFSEVS